MAVLQKDGVTPALRIKDSRVYVGIVDSAAVVPSDTIDLTTAALKGATALVITDLPTTRINAHNFLLFKDPGTELLYYPVEVMTTYSGGTSLVVAELKEDIPATAEAHFLSEVCYRTEQVNQGRRSSQTYETICHTVAEQILGGSTYSGNFPGGFSYFDGGIATLEYAALHDLKVIVEKRFPTPTATGWKSGRIERGFGTPEASGSAINGAEGLGFTVQYSSYEVIAPVPLP
jgi:hypothetical protein